MKNTVTVVGTLAVSAGVWWWIGPIPALIVCIILLWHFWEPKKFKFKRIRGRRTS
jgi:divalent metal cation (Fe/Co/Zn/Cd) transporter